MRAGLTLAATTLVASPAFAANEEWPDGPNKEFFRADCNGPMHRLGHPNAAAASRYSTTGWRVSCAHASDGIGSIEPDGVAPAAAALPAAVNRAINQSGAGASGTSCG